MTGSVCLWTLLKSGNKGLACSFFQQWVTCCLSTVVMSQALGLQSPVWPAVCTVAGLKLWAVLRFMEKSQPVVWSVNGDSVVYLLLYCLRICIRLWVGSAHGEMKTASVHWTQRAGSRASEEAARPDQCQCSLWLRWLSWGPDWPWACWAAEGGLQLSMLWSARMTDIHRHTSFCGATGQPQTSTDIPVIPASVVLRVSLRLQAC